MCVKNGKEFKRDSKIVYKIVTRFQGHAGVFETPFYTRIIRTNELCRRMNPEHGIHSYPNKKSALKMVEDLSKDTKGWLKMNNLIVVKARATGIFAKGKDATIPIPYKNRATVYESEYIEILDF